MAIEKGYISTTGKTPHASMSAAVTESIKILGESSPFERVGPATYKYREIENRKKLEITPEQEKKEKKIKKKKIKKKKEKRKDKEDNFEDETFIPKTKDFKKQEIQPQKKKVKKVDEEVEKALEIQEMLTNPFNRVTRSMTKFETEFLEEPVESEILIPEKVKKPKKKVTKQVKFLEDVKSFTGFKTLESVPIFHPSLEEFKDFSSYIEKIHTKCMEFGACRIVPPSEWKAKDVSSNQGNRTQEHLTFDFYEKSLKLSEKEIQVVSQKMIGNNGLYQVKPDYKVCQMNIESFKKESESQEVKGSFEEIDSKFWKEIEKEKVSYAFDLPESYFDKDTSWNLNRIDSLLKYIRCPMPGIITSYVDYGKWMSLFPWHVEDMDLYSITYLHFGKSKEWYCIPPKFKSKFEELSRKLFPKESQDCEHFLKHKTTLISPNYLLENGIPVYVAIQEPGEFIVTFPSSFHSGFNHGFNCAEASNFALKPWLEHAEQGHDKCKCSLRKTTWDFDMNNFKKAIKGETNYGDIVIFDI